jgi:cyclopentanol dehydrogenase
MAVDGAGRLAGRVALITGAARGMGAAEARLFAAEGAAVVLGDVLVDEGEAVAAAIESDGGRATFTTLDVRDPGAWLHAVALAEDRYGALDTLINNAAMVSLTGIEDTTLEHWSEVIAVNQTGPFLGMKAALPALRRAGGGAIVNVSSIMALVAADEGGSAAYVASKGALYSLTKTAAMELAPDGVRVNSLHPGAIDTPMADGASPPGTDARAFLAARSALRREGRPEEVAQAALFLVSDESSFVTGHALVVDGGWMAH